MAGIPIAIIGTLVSRRSLKRIKVSAGIAAALILCGFSFWHFGFIGDGSQVESRPWSNGAASIGVALAAVAVRPAAATIYNVLFSMMLVLVPATGYGNTRGWYDSAQDGLLSLALGIVIVTLMWALRDAASASDRAAVRAVERFGQVARSEAIRTERARLDGLIHDTVMATLIVAAQARSQEVFDAARKAAALALAELAAIMSGREDDSTSISRQEFVNRLQAATSGYSPVFTCEPGRDPMMFLPLGSARAIIQAATEAVRNSCMHAPGTPPHIVVRFGPSQPMSVREVTVQISDQGPGFEVSHVSPRRLGVRVSIIQRMTEADGEAQISSSKHGTTVRLTWREGCDGRG
ncbi:ATP-binding protein [Paenarthrobacter aurescens]|nr:ATP-binding protein [Paenarthrobacter aurescens]MDO6144533.1 ATP-binding protein [Paenarthrobacter aurescens]MDO6148378.1 ATP-binding protein [Paenarthrobacter aurescens]MDO6159624.1 ATP-binding protein [Paenarthrobacter aurescens]MDO6164526.1 ATP-binding protein [Paenarthrobacter aurescens]